MKVINSLVYAGLVVTSVYAEELTPDKAEADIYTDKLQNVLWNLNKIGRDNGGNRAFGYPGFNASLDFVLERARDRFGDHMDTYVQKFTHLFESTRQIKLTGPDGDDVKVKSFQYNNASPLPSGVTGELIDTPVDDERGSGCFEDQWQSIVAKDKIALVKRGGCSVAQKIKLAKAHGAVAFILYNQTPVEKLDTITLSAENIGLLVPAGFITQSIGTSWKQRLVAGESLTVTLLVDSVNEDRDCWNIISETKEGDPNNVVMLGAHLDSVPAGPGVNDDGSGTAALLEIMGSFKKYKGFKNKVRFAWWGAEEVGLVGSLYYGSQLSEQDADKIRFYFNYDMIGSPNPFYATYANNEGDKLGAKILLEYLQDNGKPAYYAKFGSSSDYVAFLKLGIPSSGLFTGAGTPAENIPDPCYHQACDTIENIHWDAITVNAKAAARAAAHFALSLDGVPPRQKTSVNPRSRKEVARAMKNWTATTRVAEKSHGCGGKDKLTI